MPGFKAIVVGENFEFEIDNEIQYLEFERTVFVEADNDKNAEATAIHMVREELLSQAILDDDSDQLLTINEIQQVDVLSKMDFAGTEFTGGFIWYIPDEDDIE